jgi:uncharacterized protein YjbI with pentapeptide repeats
MSPMEPPAGRGESRITRLPIQPNTLLSNVSATSSTFNQIQFDHCVFVRNGYFNSLFAHSSIEGATFNACNFNGSVIENSSLRGVQINNCTMEGLRINGLEVYRLLLQLKKLLGE